MIICSQTRKLIDEADSPELFSYEAARHIASCPPCKDFAEERARLRDLLATSARVTAPSNFDAMLNARLAEVRSRRSSGQRPVRSFAWSGPVGLLRFGAATAAVVIGVFAASYSGLLSGSTPIEQPDKGNLAESKTPDFVPVRPQTIEQPPAPVAGDHRDTGRPAAPNYSRRAGRAPDRPVVIEHDLTTATTQTVIVRGENFEREVTMPTVSVGAQPLLYVSASRGSAGSLRASF